MKADYWSRAVNCPEMEFYGSLCEGGIRLAPSEEGTFWAAVIVDNVVRRQFPSLDEGRAWVEAEVALMAMKDLA